MSVKKPGDENLKNNFLAAFQEIEFSKNNEKDEKSPQVVDVQRRCLAIKYLAAQKLDSEDTAASLLSQNLEDYGSQVDDIKGINNYWPQFKELGIKTNNDTKQWKSTLTDPKTMLQHLKPLPCQKDTRQPCVKKEFSDRHVEKLLNMFKNDKSERNRKLTKSPDFGRSHETRTNLNQERVRPLFNRNYDQKLNLKPYTNQENKSVSGSSSNYKYRNLESKRRFNRESCPEVEDNSKSNRCVGFLPSKTILANEQAKKNGQPPKTLGTSTRLNSKYVCPKFVDEDKVPASYGADSNLPECENELLKNIDPKMVEQIKNEIMDSSTTVTWNDIAGLEYAKRIIQEVVVIPMLRPELFTGLRQPPKGILLFGPPGTGKTLIGKCIASQSKSTFFSISASSLTSKWIGEGEKLVRALFAVARIEQPSVVFIDEIDSLLSQRSETEHESSRRMKTEFLVQLDGAATSDKDRILVLGATNRPYELDEAARRRLVKRLYIPLPEFEARVQIVENLLKAEKHELTKEDICEIGKLADGYSGADMTNLCKEASMGPIRSIPMSQMENISSDDIRKITIQDFKAALQFVRPSVSQADLTVYLDWDRTYGSGNAQSV